MPACLLMLVLPASRGLDQSTLVPAYQAGYARARAAREARLQVSSGPNILQAERKFNNHKHRYQEELKCAKGQDKMETKMLICSLIFNYLCRCLPNYDMNILIVQLDPEAAMQELAGQEGGVRVEEGAVAGTEEVAEQAYQERYIITVQVIYKRTKYTV